MVLWSIKPSGRVRSFAQLKEKTTRLKSAGSTTIRMARLELQQLRTPACSTSWRISPNAEGDEPDLEQHWLFPTRKFEAKFLNGKPLEIEYNFDPRRTRDNWVLVNVENLSPVLGGMVVAPAMNNFESIFKINNLLDIDVGYNNCSFGRHASCFCSTPEDPENMEVDGSECKYSHFHHFCGDHVGDWLLFYLFHSILLRESSPQRGEDDTLLICKKRSKQLRNFG